MRSNWNRLRGALAAGIAAIAIAVPTVMTIGDSQPVVCNSAAEAFANGAAITATQYREAGSAPLFQVCVTMPRWYRDDAATPVEVTVSRTFDNDEAATISFQPGPGLQAAGPRQARVLGSDFPDNATRSIGIAPTSDQSEVEVRIGIMTDDDALIYEATVEGRTLTSWGALNARLQMALLPTMVGVALLLLGALIASLSKLPQHMTPRTGVPVEEQSTHLATDDRRTV